MLHAMQRRSVAYVLGAIVAVAAVVIVVDLAIVTDEERLEPFLDAVTGNVTPERVDAALAFTNPSRQPVEVHAMGATQLYEDAATLRERAHEGLRPLQGESLRILGESMEVADDRATISVRFISSRAGMATATFDLRKRDDAWLLASVSVTR